MKGINNDSSDVTVIIPTLNEAQNIAAVIHELRRLGYHNIVVVDGNSKDETVEIAKGLGARIILQEGTGKGAALRQAFEGDCINGGKVVIIDADRSMRPQEIPRFIEALDSGADLAKGSRFLPLGYTKDMGLVRRVGNQFLLLLVNLIWSSHYTDLCYGFGAFNRGTLKKLYPSLRSTNFEIETEICIKALKLKLKVVEVPSIELRRKNGKSNLSTFLDGFRILRTIIKEVVDGP